MILHKQLAVSCGLEKIVIFSPNVRLEKPERRFSGRHSFEFTQVDFEIAHARKEDIFRLMEDLIVEVWRWIRETCKEDLDTLGRVLSVPKRPFKIYTTHEMVERYGEEWEIKASSSEKSPFWVVCFRREFYDKEDPSNPGHFLNYDLIYPEGYGEALSGGERETDFEKIRRRIGLIKRNKEDFDLYLKFARKHLLPSAGVGFGIERMVRYLSGMAHIRDVQLFPRIPGEEIVF
jgi:asparaginyl-tRNA synthetase